MTILIACDKFKDSISASSACEAIARGLRHPHPSVQCELHPMADGGDGSLAILSNYLSGQNITVNTKDPLGRTMPATYLIHQDTAYIELAQASGIAQLSIAERNPLLTNSEGTGILMMDALRKGIRNLVLLVGGSATNDAGMGIAQALGFRFYDAHQRELFPCGKNLISIASISPARALPPFELEILCDVTNPLYGSHGAAQVYARQKGADKEAIKLLDAGLQNFAELIKKQMGREINLIEGAGSAGGIGGGLHGLLNARLENGFDRLSEISQLEEKINKAELIITGEGKLDEQSLDGKVVGGIANLCTKYHKRLIAIVGRNQLSGDRLRQANIEKVFTILSLAKGEEEAMKLAADYLEKLSAQVVIF